jgi:uncharacterized repeat protein (TIGR03803 family)
LTTLFVFGGTNGVNPQGQLAMDTNGNFYGTTRQGGPAIFGTVFRLSTNGALTTLAAFNRTNGALPNDGVIRGRDGNFYGTTGGGGSNSVGTVFRLTPGGGFTSLVSFKTTNGASPIGGLVQGNDGVLYGTAGAGGTNLSFGTIFKLTTNGDLSSIFNFHFTDGEQPATRLIFGPDGALYGTTAFGGSTTNDPQQLGSGTVFRLTTNGLFTPLVLFQGTNGSQPQAPLVLGPDGNLYGTTSAGGPGGGGTLFRIVLTPNLTGVVRAGDGTMAITGLGPADTGYRLWTATNLSIPVSSWTLLSSGQFGSDGSFSYTAPAQPAEPARFFRLSVP